MNVAGTFSVRTGFGRSRRPGGGLVEQVECANHVVTQFIAQIDPDSMVSLTGDHWPESIGQARA
jgi:hypothetical protein